jgi:uncharacterized membrane protein YeaQ/YmgE (transglycosylase-associated protein family)
MSGTEIVLAWVGIGLCASIAGWIWPFVRGVFGIIVNMAVAVAGAVSVGLIAYMLGGPGRTLTTTSFLWAAVGAIGALTVLHLAWTRWIHAHHARRGH